MAPTPLFARAEPVPSTRVQPPFASAIIIACFSLLITLLIIPPFFWHWRNRNIGATCCVFWAILMCFVTFINALVWPNDDIPNWFSGVGLCDVEVKLQVAWGIAAPATLCCVLKALAHAMDTDRISLSKTKAQRWRDRAVDLLLCVGLPLFEMLAHYIVQFKRYAIFGVSGCQSTASRSYLTVFMVFVPPLVMVFVDAYYAILILVRLLRYRRNFAMILANNHTTKSRFMRLYILCLVWILLIIPTAVYVLYVNLSRSKASYSWESSHNATTWNEIDLVPSNGVVVFDRYIWLGSGIIVFLTFGFGRDAVTMYRCCMLAVGLGRVFPSLRTDYTGTRASKPGSFSTFSSKAKLYLSKRKSSASSWQTKSWQTDTTATHRMSDAAPVSPKDMTFLESITEVPQQHATLSSQDAEMAASPTDKPDVFGRLKSAFRFEQTQPPHGERSVAMGDMSGAPLTVRSNVSSGGQAPVPSTRTVPSTFEVVVRKEVRQGSEPAGTLPMGK